MTRRYFWEFYGPRALGTAEHFLIHLGEFFAKNNLEKFILSRAVVAPDQSNPHIAQPALVCVVAQEPAGEAIERGLKPRWSEPVPDQKAEKANPDVLP